MQPYDMPLVARGRRGNGPKTQRGKLAQRLRRERLEKHERMIPARGASSGKKIQMVDPT